MTQRTHKPALEHVTVVANDRIAPGVGLIVLHAPRCAASVAPGQFVHLRIATGADTILRRPFSIHRAYGERVEILFQILGAGTLRLAEKLAGDASMDLVGPLGHGWEVPEGLSRGLLVTGGLGAAPLGMLAEQLSGRGAAVSVAMGAPSAERLVARALFEDVARRVEVATDDGSAGEFGLVTGPAGPEPMQRAVIALAARHDVPCQVSLERLMACGIGACLSCAVSTTAGVKMACVDGPVFSAEEVVWDASQTPPKH